MGSFIRKNSPTTAKGITNEQEQLKVNAAGELLVNSTGGVNVNGKTAFADDANNPTLANTIQLGGPQTGVEQMIIPAVYNQSSQAQYVIADTQNNILAKPIVDLNIVDLLFSNGAGASPHQALAQAISTIPTQKIYVIGWNVVPTDATYSSYIAIVMFTTM